MDTKWKNLIKEAKAFLKLNWPLIPGAVLILTGIYLEYFMLVDADYRPMDESVIIGLIGNFVLGAGVVMTLGQVLKMIYENWVPEDESFYGKWKETGKKLDRIAAAAGAVCVVAAYIYLYTLINWHNYGNYYWNYAAGYMMAFTIVVQYILAQIVLNRFKNRKMDLLMEQMEEVNRRRIDVALEIEKKSLEKVTRSDQLRVDLITNVSHDLKTPLTSMVGYIELIRKEDLSDTVRDYVDVISARAEKLKEMVDSLFSLAKASSGNIELHPEKFELNRMVGQIFADMDDRIRESGLEFVTRLTEDSTELVSDNSYFYRICQNLMENALKYSAKGTRVFVKTYVSHTEKEGRGLEERLCMEITNTSAYPMDFEAEDIVERFARGDKARTGDGNGLGLAIVSTYAKALGGEFEIKIDCDQFKAVVIMPREMKQKEAGT